MNERQAKFCLSYAKCGNALQAYKEAGYIVKSDDGGRVSASRLLTNANIVAKLKELSDKAENSNIADITEVKEFWSNVLRSEEEEMKDRIKCSELIAKVQGAFIDKIEHSGEVATKSGVGALYKAINE